jgi:hypothetical protein
MSLDYTQEKAYKVLLTLGSMDAGLLERLEGAATTDLLTIEKQVRDGASGLGSKLSEDLLAFVGEISTVESLDGEGSIRATLRQLNAWDLGNLASRLVGLCIEMMQLDGPDAWKLGDG